MDASSTQVDAATSHLSSRSLDGASVGGRDGYPSDSQQAALRKHRNLATSFEDCDQAKGEMSASKGSHPISIRTRSQSTRKQKECEMAHVKSGNEDLDNGEGPEVEEESDRSDVVGVTDTMYIGLQRLQ